jgi:5-methylthioadenosine/S-adenosylhomocysteine deaminase
VRVVFCPDPLPLLTLDTLLRLRRDADQLDAPIHMRLWESRTQLEEFIARTGERPVGMLARLGLLRPGFVAVDPFDLDGSDVELLARAGCAAVFAPEAGLRLGLGIARFDALRAAGVCVALGSGAGFASSADMRHQARLARLLASGSSGRVDDLSALDALRLITVEGTRVLGGAAEQAVIAPGAPANLCAIELPATAAPNIASAYDGFEAADESALAECLLSERAATRVTDCWVSGRAQVRDGVVGSPDAPSLRGGAAHWAARLSDPGAWRVAAEARA